MGGALPPSGQTVFSPVLRGLFSLPSVGPQRAALTFNLNGAEHPLDNSEGVSHCPHPCILSSASWASRVGSTAGLPRAGEVLRAEEKVARVRKTRGQGQTESSRGAPGELSSCTPAVRVSHCGGALCPAPLRRQVHLPGTLICGRENGGSGRESARVDSHLLP